MSDLPLSDGPKPRISPEAFLLTALGAVVILAGVFWIGSLALDSPWLQGDERIFIANNPDVTGNGPSTPTGMRAVDIFLHTHEDLYQPLTILTYWVEWNLWDQQRVEMMRFTDVLIHAINTLLLWVALSALLRAFLPKYRSAAPLVGWLLAFLWAVHPMLVDTYAADMGRTHLLAATFMLIALLLHLRALHSRNWGWFIGSALALLLAMLNKPVVGWVVIVLAIEWALLGLRATLRSPRIYIVGAMCAFFALLTIWTTRETLMVEDSPLPLFGDPVTRAALSLWLYLRDFVAPLSWICSWYPPDIHTGWGHFGVWLGVAATLAMVVLIAFALTRGKLAAATAVTGAVWCWAMWLPVSGLIGARVLAARDRYFYLPAVGLLILIAIGLVRWIAAGGQFKRPRAVIAGIVAIVCAAACLPWSRTLCGQARSVVARAEAVAERNPTDPRVAEYLAAAYDYARNHDTPEGRAEEPPDFRERMIVTIDQAAQLASEHPQYFADANSRAAFHRRLSFSLWGIGALERSLAQAEAAREFEPQATLTWTRLAQACRALERWPEALAAYQKLLEIMPEDAPDRGLRYTEMGDLLLYRFDQPGEALEWFRRALAVENLDFAAKRVAFLGAARCEVLAGSGSDGYQLARAHPRSRAG